MHFPSRPKFNRSFKAVPFFESTVQIAGSQKAAVSLSQHLRKGVVTILVTGGKNKRRDESRRLMACLPAACEVSCRIRAGSPTGLWPDSPRTVASRRFGSPAPPAPEY